MKDLATAKTLLLEVLESVQFYDPRTPQKSEDQIMFYNKELNAGNIKMLPEHVISINILHDEYKISYAFIDKHSEKKRNEMIKTWIKIFEQEKNYCNKMIKDYDGPGLKEYKRFYEKKSAKIEQDIILCMQLINDPKVESRILRALDITKMEVFA